MAACYARRRWMRRRAARTQATRQRQKSGRAHSSHHKTLTMVDIPYAQSADGTVVYYASPYAVARDVEYATVLIDEEGGDNGDGGAGCSPCRVRVDAGHYCMWRWPCAFVFIFGRARQT
ncbi:hypothetical protein TW95_gp0570 [Pandoravirus inopinatum]|uniref:Uncharacterized protein n=1 Tax=Pandoravirus inopinatum TaxID=1605721 RepID=A0A0B5J1E1_9VIRU|nr:hypothetical protein TW95_gp0570 [Pandoravirus inopinatum]AJF97304.1 hypothetical protein [Pandoravirus inopinatum]